MLYFFLKRFGNASAPTAFSVFRFSNHFFMPVYVISRFPLGG